MKRILKAPIASVDFDLRQLEVFSKVVELESFSKAAEEVCLAQASVSERIATLESMVGVRLLDRLGRQAVPTKAGELLYKHAKAILKMKAAAKLELQDFLGLKTGEIRIGGSTIPGEYILPRVIGRFCLEYPDVQVSLSIASSVDIENRVAQGEFELGVVGSKGTQKTLSCQKLWKDDLVLAVPAHHRWAGRKELSLHELGNEPFIARETGSGTLRFLEESLAGAGLKGTDSLRIVARLGTSTAVKEGVKAGVGVSILSAIAVQTEKEAGSVALLKVKGLALQRHFYLVLDRRRKLSPLADAFTRFLLSPSTRGILPTHQD